MKQSPPTLPSVVEDRPSSRSSNEPLWWVLAMFAAAAVARVTMQWNLVFPACSFKRLTGVPCPLCGGTRAMRSLADLDLGTAFQFNPLVVLAAFSILGWFVLWVVDRFQERPVLSRIKNYLQRWPVWWMVGGLVLLNWAYLIRTLP